MSVLYLDCSLGVSGDMLLAALLDAGGNRAALEAGLAGLGLDSFRLEVFEQRVAGLRTLRVEVVQTRDEPLRHLSDLTRIVEGGGLPAPVAEASLAVLRSLAEAEARVHGVGLEEVHFHEIGAVDTVVDVVGTMLLVHDLAPQAVLSSPVNLGSGFVTMAHGAFPVPAPACAELSRGMRVRSTDLGMEAATPTGLALLKALAGGFGLLPEGEIRAVGVGAGGRSSDKRPTFLRAFVLDQASPA